MKTCPACKIRKLKSEFYNNKGRYDGLSSWCKICMKKKPPGENRLKRQKKRAKEYIMSSKGKESRRAYKKSFSGKECIKKYRGSPKGKESTRNTKLKSKYGITIKDYNAMLKDQGNGCAICNTNKPGGTGSFSVDHIGKTNPLVIRGLLCTKCNLGLGYFNHDIKILASAIQYLSIFDETWRTG